MSEEQTEYGPVSECRYCHSSVVSDDWFYSCPGCGAESCPDCAGRCGCDVDDDDEEPIV